MSNHLVIIIAEFKQTILEKILFIKYVHVPQLKFCRTVHYKIENNVATRKIYDEISQNCTTINYIIVVIGIVKRNKLRKVVIEGMACQLPSR